MGYVYTKALSDGFDTLLYKHCQAMCAAVNAAVRDYDENLAKLLVGHNRQLHNEEIDTTKLDSATQEKIEHLRAETKKRMIQATTIFNTELDTL